MKFQVPQFIATETKLIGPFTLKQFLWLAAGGGVIFLLFLTLKSLIFFVVAIPIGAFFAALAFIRVNETSLINYVSYGINYLFNPKQYVFKKEGEKELQEIIISEGDNRN
ncbi:MAG: PrgI family protein [bacterium]|nr:PrgI family protein [bacterium]